LLLVEWVPFCMS